MFQTSFTYTVKTRNPKLIQKITKIMIFGGRKNSRTGVFKNGKTNTELEDI